ncbi:MAG: recombination mediator RecR [Patescibacteria group bacterium]|jgi:recombination protein RecR|nr:recombination mediator RecR [Patescibacteria group bacterium]
MHYPNSIKKLVEQFAKLPTVGPRTAERYVFYLLKQNTAYLTEFGEALIDLKKGIKICKSCGAVADKEDCDICSSKNRDHSLVCVVSNTRDMISIEDTREFNGVYHILGGLIDQINDFGPDKLNIKKLVEKVKTGSVKEIILALNPNIEGETTSMYVQKLFTNDKISITRIARGLPVGADIEYADNMTITNALKYRNKLK